MTLQNEPKILVVGPDLDIGKTMFQRLQESMEAKLFSETSIFGNAATTSSSSNSTLTKEVLYDSIKAFEALPPVPNLNIIESIYMTYQYQYRFPCSKRKRIRKKWSKKTENWRTEPRKDVFMTEQGIICHPSVAERIRKGLPSFCQSGHNLG